MKIVRDPRLRIAGAGLIVIAVGNIMLGLFLLLRGI